MALRFKKNMFWCWKDKEITRGIIGFTSRDDSKFLYDFRDKLSTNISYDKGLIQTFQQGVYAGRDIVIRLFNKEDEKLVQSFFNKRTPGFFTFLFRHKYYKNWEEEFLSVRRLAKVEIETNHDFPGILIESSIYLPKVLSIEIKKVALELGLEMYENRELENINIYTNRTFGQTQCPIKIEVVGADLYKKGKSEKIEKWGIE